MNPVKATELKLKLYYVKKMIGKIRSPLPSSFILY
jgi:hypothetical protein